MESINNGFSIPKSYSVSISPYPNLVAGPTAEVKLEEACRVTGTYQAQAETGQVMDGDRDLEKSACFLQAE